MRWVFTLYDSEPACTNFLLGRGVIVGDNESKAPVEMCRVIRLSTQKHGQFTNEVTLWRIPLTIVITLKQKYNPLLVLLNER